MSEKRIVLGHLNPDTDSVISSFVYSKIAYNISYPEAEFFLTGKTNKETQFIFDKFGIQLPDKTVENIDEETEVVLVDHNIKEQRVPAVKDESVSVIIDHHQVTFSHDKPIFIRTEPVGSTATILSEMLYEHAQVIPLDVAKLLFSAIISDTLFFNSPTTKAIDRQMVDRLNKIVQIPNIQRFANQMFEAKSDLSGLTMEEILSDSKIFEMGSKKVRITVLETVDTTKTLEREQEMIEYLSNKKESEGNLSFLFIVDIIKKYSIGIAFSDEESDAVKNCWPLYLEDESGRFILDGLVSRKAQMVPALKKYFEEK